MSDDNTKRLSAPAASGEKAVPLRELAMRIEERWVDLHSQNPVKGGVIEDYVEWSSKRAAEVAFLVLDTNMKAWWRKAHELRQSKAAVQTPEGASQGSEAEADSGNQPADSRAQALCDEPHLATSAPAAPVSQAQELPKHLVRRGLTEHGYPLADDDAPAAPLASADGGMPEEPTVYYGMLEGRAGGGWVSEQAYDALKSTNARLAGEVERLKSDYGIMEDEFGIRSARLRKLEETCAVQEYDLQRLRREPEGAVLAWLDNNTTFSDGEPVLLAVSTRVWYHATDDTDSYPFSAVIRRALASSRERKGDGE